MLVINRNANIKKPKRVSYYLDIKTIEKIEQLALESNKGISMFLQELLNYTLDKIEIE